MQTLKPTVEIQIEAPEPKVRNREPVTCGIPWPKGMLHEPSQFVLVDENQREVPVKARVLDRWSDGSIRRLLLDWQATVNGDTKYRLEVSSGREQGTATDNGGIRTEKTDERIIIDTGL